VVRSHFRVLSFGYSRSPFSCKSIVVQVLCAVRSYFRVFTVITHAVLSHVWVLWSPFLYAFRFHLWALSSHFSIDPFSCGITVVFASLCSPFSYTSVVSVPLCGPFSRRSMLSLCFSAPVYCCGVCSDVRKLTVVFLANIGPNLHMDTLYVPPSDPHCLD